MMTELSGQLEIHAIAIPVTLLDRKPSQFEIVG